MKKLLLFCFGGLMVAALSGCRHTFEERSKFTPVSGDFARFAATNQLDASLLRPTTAPFTLGPGDRLEIETLGHPETRAVTFVGPDGKLYYYLAPGLNVWGLTLGQTTDLLEKELAKYLSEPRVTVTLREVGSKYVWLLGRLNRPGIYPLPGPMTLIESLAQAGGTARSSSQTASLDLADLRHSFVMRGGQFLPVNFERLLRQGDMSQNIYLQPDDFVYVRSALSQEVYVLGRVRTPRAVPYTEQMTLASALAAASGPAKYNFFALPAEGSLPRDALMSHVTIVRGSLAEPKIAVVNAADIIKGKAPDVPLEPGDIIYVPNNYPSGYIKSYLNLAISSFVSTVAANEGIRAGGGQVGVGVSVPVAR